MSYRLKPLHLTGWICVLATLPFARFHASAQAPLAAEFTRILLERQAAGGPLAPPAFSLQISDRQEIDQFQSRVYAVKGEDQPEARRYQSVRIESNAITNVVTSERDEKVGEYRRGLLEIQPTVRGFKAPILRRRERFHPPVPEGEQLAPDEAEAALIVAQSLPQDGLLLTLSKILRQLPNLDFEQNARESILALCRIGYPADLLRHFDAEAGDPSAVASPESAIERAAAVAARVQDLMTRGASAAEITAGLAAMPFRFVSTDPSFRLASEAGEEPLSRLRLQIGGGFQNGVVVGGSIDVAHHLMTRCRDLDFFVSVPEQRLEMVQYLATNFWRRIDNEKITWIAEPNDLTPWAQDNGKGGSYTPTGTTERDLATITPRYASQGEDKSNYVPSDSYLFDGLQAAGHNVIHSPLLFQGGNLIPYRDPNNGRRVLLVGESEIYRNTALGLTRQQVLEAFAAEFSVDECVVVPVVSFHLDYDVTLRVQDFRVLAFVNDMNAASVLVVRRGIRALGAAGIMDRNMAERLDQHLAEKDPGEVLPFVLRILDADRDSGLRFSEEFAAAFRDGPGDTGHANLQRFLVALDVLATNGTAPVAVGHDHSVHDYFAAIKRLRQRGEAQRRLFQDLGFEIVSVPSMPDMQFGANYLNSIHEPKRLILPVLGGFFSDLDEAAIDTFRRHLDANVRIVPIPTGASQESHGGVRCMVSIFTGT